MCGIIGYIGNKNASEIILNGLKRLEYRGYDSVGISIYNENQIESIKSSGKVIDLAKKVDKNIFVGTSGIGHTRWATHGRPSTANAHPHKCFKIKYILYIMELLRIIKSLKEFLIGKGVTFKSDTDTEVLSNL